MPSSRDAIFALANARNTLTLLHCLSARGHREAVGAAKKTLTSFASSSREALRETTPVVMDTSVKSRVVLLLCETTFVLVNIVRRKSARGEQGYASLLRTPRVRTFLLQPLEVWLFSVNADFFCHSSLPLHRRQFAQVSMPSTAPRAQYLQRTFRNFHTMDSHRERRPVHRRRRTLYYPNYFINFANKRHHPLLLLVPLDRQGRDSSTVDT